MYHSQLRSRPFKNGKSTFKTWNSKYDKLLIYQKLFFCNLAHQQSAVTDSLEMKETCLQVVKVWTLGRQNERNSYYVRLAHTSTFGLCFISVCLMKSNCYSLIYSLAAALPAPTVPPPMIRFCSLNSYLFLWFRTGTNLQI